MKVKTINKNTNQQFDCEEVEIDGYKYYLYYNTEPKKIGQYYITKDNQVDIVKTGKELGKPILYTNNPYIDIPKVVDEVDLLSYINKLANQRFTGWTNDEMKGYKTALISITEFYKSQETYPFSEEDMIEFSEWKDFNFYQHIEDNLYRTMQARPMYKSLENKSYTTKELLQLWKEQQPKIVYYNG